MNVFPDNRDLRSLLRADYAVDKFLPARQIRLRRFQVQQIANEFVQSLGVQHEWHLVNRVLDIERFDYGFLRHAAEHRQLLAQLAVDWFLAPANQDLRLQTDLAQFRDALLRRFRF